MPVKDFVWVGETEHNISRTGKVFFSLPLEEQIPVLEGDILGLYWDSKDDLIRQAATTNPLPEFKVDNDPSGFAGRSSTEYHFPGSQTVDKHYGDHLVMAHAVRPMIFKVSPVLKKALHRRIQRDSMRPMPLCSLLFAKNKVCITVVLGILDPPLV